jgi:hypothetical protein
MERLLRSRRTFIALFFLGLCLRLVFLPLPGTSDVGAFKIWVHAAGTGPVSEMYGVGGEPPERRLLDFDGRQTTVNYPPVALYELALVGMVYDAVVPGFPDGAALTVAVKLLPVAAEVGLFWLRDTLCSSKYSSRNASNSDSEAPLAGTLVRRLGAMGYSPTASFGTDPETETAGFAMALPLR